MAEPMTMLGLGGLAITNITAIIIVLIKERRRSKTMKSNGRTMEDVRTIVNLVNKKIEDVRRDMASVSTDIQAMKNYCQLTTGRFEQEITQNRRDILGLTKK